MVHFLAVSRGGSIQRSNGMDDLGDTDMPL
jgi:hypothetical protein